MHGRKNKKGVNDRKCFSQIIVHPCQNVRTLKGWLLSSETTAYPLTQCDAVRT